MATATATAAATTSSVPPAASKPKLYGREKDLDFVAQWLLTEESGSEDPCVFSVLPIVGPDGVGKTAVAQHLYFDDEGVLGDHFHCKAWVYLSSLDFDVFNITKSILKSVAASDADYSQLDEDIDPIFLLNYAGDSLKDQLSGKRFLIVLDDASLLTGREWTRLSDPFVSALKGSKVLITCSNSNVVPMVTTGRELSLSRLPEKDCFSMLADQINLGGEGTNVFTRHPSLLPLASALVTERCSGLPMMVNAIGSVLRGKYDQRDWKDVLDHSYWNHGNQYADEMAPVLALCYDFLSPELKQCFASCSRFPMCHEFNEEEILSLWIRDGLFSDDDNSKDLGRKALRELQSAGPFFQQSSYDPSTMVMHYLIYLLPLWDPNPNPVDVPGRRDVEDDETDGYWKKAIGSETIFQTTNLVLEIVSAVFEQISSLERPVYALWGMILALLALLMNIFNLFYKCSKPGATWKWKPSSKNPINNEDRSYGDAVVGTLCALCQFIVTAVGYGYIRQHAENPIKISPAAIVLVAGQLLTNFKLPQKRAYAEASDSLAKKTA